MERKTKTHGFKAIKIDDAAGIVEAIVSVFDNVDHAGERVRPGAFAKSIDRWRASGDPIPVIWSHQWHNLDAHVGKVDPAKIEELAAGDERLPAELKDLGGLYAPLEFDLDDADGAKTFRLISDRRVKEFSFAYDVLDASEAEDLADVIDLNELDLIEIGPTLKGMNPATAVLSAKAAAGLFAELLDALRTGKAGEPFAVLADRLELKTAEEDLELEPDTKAGRRNAAKDLERIQNIHDLTRALGADCKAEDAGEDAGEEDEEKAEEPDTKAALQFPTPAQLTATLTAELIDLT